MNEPRCTGTKQCARCGRVLTVFAFAVDHHTKDGLRPECRDCASAYENLRRLRSVRPVADADWTFGGGE